MKHTAMTRPQYLDPDGVETKGGAKIKLEGCVLVFGCGDLIHENLFFDLEGVEQLVLYDPRPRERDCHTTLTEALDAAEGSIDTALFLFSLHFEPQWLRMLCRVLGRVKIGGTIYFAEDRGFRAAIDSGYCDDRAREALGPRLDLIRDLISRRNKTTRRPWLPDISASDYGICHTLLGGLVGVRQTSVERVFERKYVAEEEPQCYLPWSTALATPELTKELEEILTGLTSVTEVVRLSGIRVERPLPALFREHSPAAVLFWRAHRELALGRLQALRVPLTGTPEKAAETYFEAYLSTCYLALFRHMPTLRAVELIVGMSRFAQEEQRAVADSGLERNLNPLSIADGRSNARDLSLSFRRPIWYSDYIRRAREDGSFIASRLWEGNRAGVYCWPKAPDEASGWRSRLAGLSDGLGIVPLEGTLLDAFRRKKTPPCIYAVDSQAVEGRPSERIREHLLGAIVGYTDPEAAPDGLLVTTLAALANHATARLAYLEHRHLFRAEEGRLSLQAAISGARHALDQRKRVSIWKSKTKDALMAILYNNGMEVDALLARAGERRPCRWQHGELTLGQRLKAEYEDADAVEILLKEDGMETFEVDPRVFSLLREAVRNASADPPITGKRKVLVRVAPVRGAKGAPRLNLLVSNTVESVTEAMAEVRSALDSGGEDHRGARHIRMVVGELETTGPFGWVAGPDDEDLWERPVQAVVDGLTTGATQIDGLWRRQLSPGRGHITFFAVGVGGVP